MANGNGIDSQEWLKLRMSELGMSSIADLESATGINRGTLSRYFRGLQRPSIDLIPVLCEALRVSPLTLLDALGVKISVSSTE